MWCGCRCRVSAAGLPRQSHCTYRATRKPLCVCVCVCDRVRSARSIHSSAPRCAIGNIANRQARGITRLLLRTHNCDQELERWSSYDMIYAATVRLDRGSGTVAPTQPIVTAWHDDGRSVA